MLISELHLRSVIQFKIFGVIGWSTRHASLLASTEPGEPALREGGPEGPTFSPCNPNLVVTNCLFAVRLLLTLLIGLRALLL